MIEKLSHAFSSGLAFPLDGGRQGWGCKKNKNAGHPHLDSFDGVYPELGRSAQKRHSPVEGEEIRFRK
jgi:hypothetical protein